MTYDLVIIGGGPAGVAAGVYASRKKIKTLLITESFGGQSLVSPGIENWIGDIELSGLELAKKLEAHIRRYEKDGDLEIWNGDLVREVKEEKSTSSNFSLLKGRTVSDKEFITKSVLVCSGSGRRRLGVPGEDKLDGKGVAWCATCDAPLFQDKTVAVIGGGNVGLEATLTLNSYAKKLYLLQRSEKLKGDPSTQEKVLSLPKLTAYFNANIVEIIGDDWVRGLRFRDTKNNQEKVLDVEGVFVEIGSVPNVEFVRDLVDVNKWGEIIVNHRTQRTSFEGIWAAGDVTDIRYKQNNISVGDAVKATLNIFEYLNK